MAIRKAPNAFSRICMTGGWCAWLFYDFCSGSNIKGNPNLITTFRAFQKQLWMFCLQRAKEPHSWQICSCCHIYHPSLMTKRAMDLLSSYAFFLHLSSNLSLSTVHLSTLFFCSCRCISHDDIWYIFQSKHTDYVFLLYLSFIVMSNSIELSGILSKKKRGANNHLVVCVS